VSYNKHVPWVLVDVSYLAYRALHSLGHLSWEGEPSGVVFGLFQQLKTICQDPRVHSNRVGLFFDSRTSYREEVFPDYKKKRRDKRSEEEKALIATLWEQVHRLRKKGFKQVGLPCYLQRGLESDDLLAMAVHQVEQRGERSIVVTADGDLYQAIGESSDWYDPARALYYTRESFEEARGIDPRKWGQVKTIAGCKSDNVPGVPGIGEKTAVKYLLGTLPQHLKSHARILSEQGEAVRRFNRRLVQLPHELTRPVSLKDPSWNFPGFLEVCEEYGLRSVLKQKNSWRNFFQGSGGGFFPRKRGEAYGR
jgi:DNA polymerase-1